MYVWGVLKNLYLFFCFLESANNVRTKQQSVQPETKSKRSVWIEIEEQPFCDQKNIHKSKMCFPGIFDHFCATFPFLSRGLEFEDI